jgi:hypothetical protein
MNKLTRRSILFGAALAAFVARPKVEIVNSMLRGTPDSSKGSFTSFQAQSRHDRFTLMNGHIQR